MFDNKTQNYGNSHLDLSNSKAWLIVDATGNIKYCNSAFVNTFKLNKDDNLKSINLLPDMPGVLAKLSENNMHDFKNSFIYENDEAIINFLVEIEKVKLFNSFYFIIVFNAQEEEKYIDARISNLHYALEFGAIPVILFNKSGIVFFATNSSEELLDFELDKIYNENVTKLFTPFLNKENLDAFQTAINNGVKWEATISIETKDKQQIFLELILNPVLDEDGKISNFVLTAHDITYYIFKNEVVQKSAEQLKSIINNISDMLLVLKKVDSELLFEVGNDNFMRNFDLVINKETKTPYNTILPNHLVVAIDDAIHKMKMKLNNNVEFKLADGGKIYLCKITSVENSVGNELLYIISLQDISDEIQKKEKLNELYKKEIQLNKLKTTFLQNMSHEIRTPFTAIMGYSDIMVESIEDEDYETVVEITDSLKHVLTRVMNLFENILEVSEIESGEVKLDNVAINCNQILQAVYNKKLQECIDKNLTFDLDLESQNYLCFVDWVKFERIILNLVDNAIKYTKKGRVKLSSKKVNNHVVLTVSDTGLGLNQKIISRLLEPFVQEETDGHSRNYEGAGLGLTIAHEYTKLMNGTMDIFSEKNVGTEVFLNFPILNQ